MREALKVVVIGGVAAGPKAACRIGRLNPDAQVTVVERGDFLSFAGCGLPYYVSDVVESQEELMSTPAGVLRDTVFFQRVKNVNVLPRCEALEIDRRMKRVRVSHLQSGEESWLGYDKLVLATGSRPVVPPLPGVELASIFTMNTIPDATGVKALLAGESVEHAVIVGGGLIGVEMAEALVEAGCQVTLVEMLPRILHYILDDDMAVLVQAHMESKGVKVLTGTTVSRFEGDGKVARVVMDGGEIPADLVILATGVRPNVELAVAAELDIGETGAISVDPEMRTSDPDIYAAGDCVESVNMLTGRPVYVPLGSTANKQGRVAANSICGVKDRFPGVMNSTVCKVFDFSVARTGISADTAAELGWETLHAWAPGPDKAHYMPDSRSVILKLIVDRSNRLLLGAQAIGPGECAKRIDVAATAIAAGMTVDQVAELDLTYAPPYNQAIDELIVAANVARNKLDGLLEGVPAAKVREKLDRGDDFVFLDVRSPGEVAEAALPGSVNIPLGALRSRLDELPRDKEIVAFCKVSLRGYEAARILQGAGYERVKVMDGGMAAWPC